MNMFQVPGTVYWGNLNIWQTQFNNTTFLSQIPGRTSQGNGDSTMNEEYVVFEPSQVMPLCLISMTGETWWKKDKENRVPFILRTPDFH